MNQMEKAVFIERLFELLDYHFDLNVLDRELVISINRACYGDATMAVLELNGSPPKLSIVLDLSRNKDEYLNRGTDTYTLRTVFFVVNYEKIRKTAKKRGEIIQLIYKYLNDNGYLEKQNG